MKEISRIAKVEDNRDPEQLGRVKVRIYPEFESLDVVSLPWTPVCQERQLGLSGFQNRGLS